MLKLLRSRRPVICGRFEIHSAPDIIAKIFQIDSVTFDIKPSYHIAPGRDAAVVMKGLSEIGQARE